MATDTDDQGFPRAAFALGEHGLSVGETAALAFGALWAIVTGLILLFSDGGGAGDPLRGIVAFLAVFLPLGLAGLGVISHRAGRRAGMEAARLAAAADALRQFALSERQGRSAARVTSTAPATPPKATPVEPPLVAEPPATFSSRRQAGAETAAARTPTPKGTQSALDLPGVAADEDVSMADIVVALNFPETPDDREGFRALRRALKDHRVERLIRQSQDVLTLLSQDGIYMDDFAPDRARPELWRRFANGERGRMFGTLGGIRDDAALTRAAGRMREDTIFRDAAHHFLRSFDQTFGALEPEMTDEDIARLTETRTARAFMLLGRAAGIFD